ncbi:hemerythrin family protein [bacterium]|nr:hemerythrin family protein [bacterium]
MPLLEWKEDYALHISEIDEQHKRLLQLINEFYAAIIEQDVPPLGQLISGMLEYSSYHFATEQRYMEQNKYPELEAHRREHDLFIARTQGFYERYKEGRFMSSLEITNFLKEWIADHLANVDQKLGKFLVKKGLS